MEYFLTTYSKDYKWPVVFSSPKDAKRQANLELKLLTQVYGEGDRDICNALKTEPIAEPEIAPAQCGAPPVGPESKYGQPNTYLRKLYMKYPYLYNILSITPPEELAKHVYADKYMSTYRSDYKMEGFTPLKAWLAPEMPAYEDRDMSKAAELDAACRSKTTLGEGDTSQATAASLDFPTGSKECQKKEGCRCPPTQAVCTCEQGKQLAANASAGPGTPHISVKPISLTKIPRAPLMKKLKDEEPPEYLGSKKPPRMSRMKSEYKDTISRMGGIIIDKKLLMRWPKEDH